MCHYETISDTNAIIQYLIELLYTNDEVINGTYKLELIVVNHHTTVLDQVSWPVQFYRWLKILLYRQSILVQSSTNEYADGAQ